MKKDKTLRNEKREILLKPGTQFINKYDVYGFILGVIDSGEKRLLHYCLRDSENKECFREYFIHIDSGKMYFPSTSNNGTLFELTFDEYFKYYGDKEIKEKDRISTLYNPYKQSTSSLTATAAVDARQHSFLMVEKINELVRAVNELRGVDDK